VRDDLNMRVPRVMAVARPLRLVITNYPENQVETLDAPLYPHDVPLTGSRPVPFGRELWIERDDFMEDPPKKFFRLSPGREVRLRYAYLITCTDVVKDARGEVVEVHATYDPATRGGDAPDGRRVQGTIHWVSAPHALDCELRLYDRLFTVPDPDALPEGQDFVTALNPESLVTLAGAKIEPSVADDAPGSRYQFERTGYFIRDPVESRPGALVFNRTVALRDSWAKVKGR
jgi:glutaminyl-tRNA synthetase